MTNRELIEELQRQKTLIGTEIFDEKLLEQYLTLSVTKQNEPEEKESYENNSTTINIHGIESLSNIKDTLNGLEPFHLETKANGFKQAQGPWITLYTIARKTDEAVQLPINYVTQKQYQKTQIIPFKNGNTSHKQAA